jgi:hypothetical protein
LADVFSLLTDREGNLSSAPGDAQGVIGMSSDEIGAKPIFELFSEDDKSTVASALRAASRTAQTQLTGLCLQTGDDSAPLFDISIEPAGPELFWVRFTPSEGETVESGPAPKERFLDAVAARLGMPDGSGMRLLMVDVDGLRDRALATRLGDDGTRDLQRSIEGALGNVAVDGQIGQLSAGSYGVLGAADLNTEDVLASVADVAGEHGVTADDLGAHAENVVLDAVDGDVESVRGLLSHVCHKFYQTVRNGAPFGAARLSEVPAEIEQAVRLVETALEQGDIEVTMRDVRGLAAGDVSLYLASGALVFGDETAMVDRILVVADHPALCQRHDRAVIDVALTAIPDTGASVPVIVDICLPTLETGEASRIGAEMAAAGRSVGFRPIGLDMSQGRSSGVRQVYGLLKEGIPVWLANFSAAISKSRRLKGAYVEISAPFLRDISAHPDRNKLLSGLLKVWHEVEVRLVATNVDSKNLASFVNKLGIIYGIGIAADPAADAPQSTRDIAN